MCGRYALTSSDDILAELFNCGWIPQLPPRYNIAPTQDVPVVRAGEQSSDNRCDLLKWGLVPSWADDEGIGNRMINARSESAATKPAFRSAMKYRRCLVPADAFYEWKKVGTRKQPYCIRRKDGKPYAFAGLWEQWRGRKNVPDDEKLDPPLQTFTILTTDANDLLREYHHRMPVILDPKDYQAWLDPQQTDPQKLKSLLTAPPDDWFEVYPISTRVNKPANDDPSVLEPIKINGEEVKANEDDGEDAQQRLFE